MAKSRGLGRGLDALIPRAAEPVPAEAERPREGEVVLSLSLADIDPNREQPRKRFDAEGLEQLAQSIRNVGVLQPIIVCATEGGALPHNRGRAALAGGATGGRVYDTGACARAGRGAHARGRAD